VKWRRFLNLTTDNLYHLLRCNVTTSSDSDHVVDGLLMAVMKNGQVFRDTGLPPTEIKESFKQLM